MHEQTDDPRYWLLNGPVPTGPFSLEELRARFADLGNREARVCRLGETQWRPLAEMMPAVATDGQFRGNELPPPPLPPIPKTPPTAPKKDSRGGPWSWLPSGAAIFMFLVALGRISKGCIADPNKAKPDAPRPVPVQQWRKVENPMPQPLPSTARISVSAQDGTPALQALVAQLPDEQIAFLGLRTVLTRTDTYGVHVRIRNKGTIPVRVFPTNFRMHFGAEATFVTTASHPAFLQPCLLDPGEAAEGLVMYDARIDAGAVIRMLGTSFTYDDSTILVDYS